MNILFYLLFVQLCVVIYSNRSVYRMVLQRLDILDNNEDYGIYRISVSKLDRYTVAGNAYLVVKKPGTISISVDIRVYEFLNNEYRPFAINYKRSLCSFLEIEYKHMFYPDLLRIGAHMPEPKCPLPVGNYSFKNYVPDENNFPVNLPFKKTMLEIKIVDDEGDIVVAVLRAYLTFDRDVVIRERYG